MTSIEETTAAQVVAAVAHEMARVALAETSEATEAAPPEPKLGARRARRAKADAATATEAAASAAEMRRGRKPNTAEGSKQDTAAPAADTTAPRLSKLDRLAALLARPEGASLAEMMTATGWQAHSVRGAMAGSLRKRGHAVASARDGDGVRRYRIGGAA